MKAGLIYMQQFDLLKDDPEKVAPRLLGCLLLRNDGNQQMSGLIVETEAYDQSDVASHSYHGETPRTKIMFGDYGRAYVYFTYGMHFCFNVVTGPVGHGSAVLIRAIEPIKGKEFMLHNRRLKLELSSQDLTNGPAKLCQALNIDKQLNGHDLRFQPLQLIINPAIDKKHIVQSNRIGISQGKELLWRFYLKK